ncbi:MAG: hypothetical protein ABIF19_01560 [Planctomycetota bacterium]
MRERFPFYVWLLPLIWGVCSYAHHNYPGDENAMWLISSAAGSWLAPFAFVAGASKQAVALAIALAGALVIGAAGFAMDWFRVRKLLWAILFVFCSSAIFVTAIMSYPSIERAISKNGSLWAYILFSINIGIYASIILSVCATLIVRVARRKRKGS